MKRGSSKPQQIDGPNGLAIKSENLRFFRAPIPQTVRPEYAPNGVTLAGALARADGFLLRFGGSLAQVPVLEQAILESSGTLAIAFDANQDKAIDSFFLSDYTLAFPSIAAFGLQIDNAKVTLKDLSNHPALLENQSVAAGGWLGSIALSGSTVGFSVLPDLRLVPAAQGGDVFQAVYDLASGDLTARLGEVDYRSPQISVLLSDGTLVLRNSNKDVVVRGKGIFSLPGLGISGLGGDLDLRVTDAKLNRIGASVITSAPIGALGLAGRLMFEHDESLKSGSVVITDATVAGVAGLGGVLRYGDEKISGSLTVEPTDYSLNLGGFNLRPLGGTVNLDYAWRGENPGGSLRFTDLNVAADLNGSSATFKGDISLDLDATGITRFSSASLSLSSDLDVNLDGFNLRLIANDPLAPVRLSLTSKDGVLVPAISGKAAFRDLNGLTLTIPEGGLSFGSKGWSFSDVQLNLGENLDLGAVRFGEQASARIINGSLRIDPDLSINLDGFNLALGPVGQFLQNSVLPITSAVVTIYSTDIDLNSVNLVRDGMAQIRDKYSIDLPAAWLALVDLLEDVPGNPFQDRKLTVGELLDFANYQAYLIVRDDPNVAAQVFKQLFNADLPAWLLGLPKEIDYASLSMSAAIGKLNAINQLVVAMAAPPSSTGQWLSLPLTLELTQNTSQPSLVGGASARENLEQQLRQLALDLQRLDQLSQPLPGSDAPQLALRPLAFDYDLEVPLFDNPLGTLLDLITAKPFDVVRADFSLSSGVNLSYAYSLDKLLSLSSVFPRLIPQLQLEAGLGAQLALSLGLSSTAPVLSKLAQSVASGSINRETLSSSFAGRDPITGQPIGVYLSQVPGKDLLQLSPSARVGLGIGFFGVDASAYGQVDGTIDLSLTTVDGSNRVFIADVFNGLDRLPGLKAQGSVFGEVGLKVDTFFGDTNPNFRFPIVENANLFAIPAQSPSFSLFTGSSTSAAGLVV